MNKLIITGHGEYATGILSALKMLSGNLDNIIAIDFKQDDTEETLLDKYKKVIDSNTNYIFICDLLGGTPYKVSAKLSYENKNIKIVTGANLGGIIDSNFKINKLTLEELVTNLIESSKKNLMVLNIEKKEENNSDGI